MDEYWDGYSDYDDGDINFPGKDKDLTWFRYCPSMTAILMLYYLPKLRKLVTNIPTRDFDALQKCFNMWAYQLLEEPMAKLPICFGELKTIRLENPESNEYLSFPPFQLWGLMMCPKIEDISLHTGYKYDMFDQAMDLTEIRKLGGSTRRSTIKDLKLDFSLFPGWDTIRRVLKTTIHLQDLKILALYPELKKTKDCDYLGPNHAISRCKDTLRCLFIGATNQSGGFRPAEWIGDLSDFPNLRIVTLPCDIFLAKRDWRQHVNSLTKSLPPGLEELTLNECTESHWIDLFNSGALHDILGHLQSLKKLWIETDDILTTRGFQMEDLYTVVKRKGVNVLVK